MLIARNHHDLPHNERGALHPRQDVHEAQDPRDREGDAEGRERDADEAIPGGVTVGQRERERGRDDETDRAGERDGVIR